MRKMLAVAAHLLKRVEESYGHSKVCAGDADEEAASPAQIGIQQRHATHVWAVKGDRSFLLLQLRFQRDLAVLTNSVFELGTSLDIGSPKASFVHSSTLSYWDSIGIISMRGKRWAENDVF
jgi:hypothetical protein